MIDFMYWLYWYGIPESLDWLGGEGLGAITAALILAVSATTLYTKNKKIDLEFKAFDDIRKVFTTLMSTDQTTTPTEFYGAMNLIKFLVHGKDAEATRLFKIWNADKQNDQKLNDFLSRCAIYCGFMGQTDADDMDFLHRFSAKKRETK